MSSDAAPAKRPTTGGVKRSTAKDFKVGDLVLVLANKKPGIVRWIGVVDITADTRTFLGIEYHEPIGRFNGTVTTSGGHHTKQYFSCPDKHGDFILPRDVRLFSIEEQAALAIQAATRGWLDRQKFRQEMVQRVWNILEGAEEKDTHQARAIYAALRKGYMSHGHADPSESTGREREKERERKAAVAAAAGKGKGREEDKAKEKPISPPPMLDVPMSIFQRTRSELWEDPSAPVGDAPRINNGRVTMGFVVELMEHFRRGGRMNMEDALWLIRECELLFEKQPHVVTLPTYDKLTIVGDTHGQLDDLLFIFNHNGFPSADNPYLFNGDFVDRGEDGCEITLLLFAYKLLLPNHVHLNRGNHESRHMNLSRPEYFASECYNKYSREVFDAFTMAFTKMPLAHIVQKKVFVVHGGVPTTQLDLKEIEKMDIKSRFCVDSDDYEKMPEVFIDMLWNDPVEEKGIRQSSRGAGYFYGPDITQRFLEINSLSYVVRSHELRDEMHDAGYMEMHGGKCFTIFSASDYCGTTGNLASWCIIRGDGGPPEIVPFFAEGKEHFSPLRAHRNDVIEADVIYQLVERIAINRQALLEHYMTVDAKRTGSVTRQQLQQGLKRVLQLELPFLYFAEGLGVPGKKFESDLNAPVDYVSWLRRFRTIHRALTPISYAFPPGAASPLSDDGKRTAEGAEIFVDEDSEITTDFIYRNRVKLEVLFRHFDRNNSGEISETEFEHGIAALNKMQKVPLTEKQVKQLLACFRKMEESQRKYGDFFKQFEYVDPVFREQAERRNAIMMIPRLRRQKSGFGTLISPSPSPPISPSGSPTPPFSTPPPLQS